jgi:predicted ATP-grasp superfamily ATP-dependent carboligase
MSVLVTDARLRTCLYVARSLGREGLSVFAGESAWFSPHFTDPRKVLSFRSKFCKGFFFYPHPADSDSFIPYMANQAKNFDAVIPINEDTIIPICENSEKFPNSLLPRFQDLQIATDKKKVMDLCLTLGVPTPQTYFPSNQAELRQLSEKLHFPVIVKWRRETVGYPRYRICYSKKDLYETMQRTQSDPIIQAKVEGFGVGFFALFDKNHRLKAYFIHKRIREYPISGGPSSCCASYWNRQILEYGLRLLRALNWVGIGMVEFKLDNTDRVPKVLEINPRFWGSLPLAILSGVDFPYLLYKLIIGEDFSPILRYNLNTSCRFTNDFSALSEIFRKSKHKFAAAKSVVSSIPIRYADFDFRDQLTSIIMMEQVLKTVTKIPKKILRV